MDFRDFEQTIIKISHTSHIEGLEPDDIAQELRIAVWKSQSKYDPHKSSPQTFFNRIVKNTLTNLYKKTQTNKNKANNKTVSMDEIKEEDIL